MNRRQQAEVASRLYKWPKSYEKMIDKMDWFRNIANAYVNCLQATHLLNVVDVFEEQAKRSLERLKSIKLFGISKKRKC